MKRIVAFLTITLCLFSAVSFANVGWKDKGNNVGAITDINTSGALIPQYDGSTLTVARLGFAKGDSAASAYATIASGATAITSTQLAYAIIKKDVGDGAEVGALANGTPGQMLTIICTSLNGSGTYTVTPVTKTGFTSFQLNTALDSITLLYFNDSIGWIVFGNNGCTLA